MSKRESTSTACSIDLTETALWDLGMQPFPEDWGKLSGRDARLWRICRPVFDARAGHDLWYLPVACEERSRGILTDPWPSPFCVMQPDHKAIVGWPAAKEVAPYIGEWHVAYLLPTNF